MRKLAVVGCSMLKNCDPEEMKVGHQSVRKENRTNLWILE
jgi:hypothetical protein